MSDRLKRVFVTVTFDTEQGKQAHQSFWYAGDMLTEMLARDAEVPGTFGSSVILATRVCFDVACEQLGIDSFAWSRSAK